MTDGDTSEYFDRGIISVNPSEPRSDNCPLYNLTKSVSWSVVRQRRSVGSLDEGTIKANLIESPCLTLLSRVTNWEDLAILRPFEDSVLQSLRVDEELTEYEEILKYMDRETPDFSRG